MEDESQVSVCPMASSWILYVSYGWIFAGVAGLSLGAGYSWKVNQYGLGIDTIVSHNVVLPSGKQVQTSNVSYSDLFFGLKVMSSLSPLLCVPNTLQGRIEQLRHRHEHHVRDTSSDSRIRM